MSILTEKSVAYNVEKDNKNDSIHVDKFQNNNKGGTNDSINISLDPTITPTSVSSIINQDAPITELSQEAIQEKLESLQLLKDLDLFLVTAPVNWHENQVIRRYFLNKEEGFVSCVYWNNLYFITGTDIVRCIAYKMTHIGRRIVDRKKFEEGIFSDLRALKYGTHAVLENSRSPFLKFLHRNQCLRTQKKQKVFFWFSVPHNKLFSDVLERDLKRELSNQQPTTEPVSEMFRSFQFDQSSPVLEQLSKHFSNCLCQNVDHLLIPNTNILSATTDSNNKQNFDYDSADATTNNNDTTGSNNVNRSSNDTNHIIGDNGMTATSKIKQENDSNIFLPQQNPVTQPISDDFPLDLLNPLVDKGYITTLSEGDEANVNINGNGQYPIYVPQENQQSQNYQDPNMEGFILNSFNQSIMPSYYSQQQISSNQPMYVLSGLPSAVDPTSTFSNQQNHHGRNSPSSNSISQLIPMIVQQPQMMASPSAVIMNNNQIPIEQMMVPQNETNQQQSQILYSHPQIIRSSSPMLTNNSNFFNLPSAGLIPINMPLSSSTSKLINHLDLSTEDYTDQKLYSPTSEKKNLVKNEKLDSGKKSKSNSVSNPIMVSMPNSGIPFGIVNGQLFTPGAGVDYNYENPALSAGIGISPVIGFNNGMLSAIQYQHNNSFVKVGEKDDEADDNDDDESKDDNDDNNDEDIARSRAGLKGENIDGKSHKITKPKNNKHSKIRFLNPTLQHLQLDSVFDDNEESNTEADAPNNELFQTEEPVVERNSNI